MIGMGVIFIIVIIIIIISITIFLGVREDKIEESNKKEDKK